MLVPGQERQTLQANPVVIKPVDHKRRTIGKRERFRLCVPKI